MNRFKGKTDFLEAVCAAAALVAAADGEIEDIKDDPDMAETVYLTALDISESDGQIEPEEKAVLEKIAAKLGLNPANYDV
ncbi:TerB [Roseibium sp. TrichSKD4]|uniref:tellurite resistance TerB family protein n=1 Tax=Roseibium sp. TrichSKD4 TaxID=744980 RepID=UPI0001E5665D|nr:tellurite resistance TerB family protein [Roseibium sp. TrichSKD4]EFO33575.1 TerB [Roseibium sp. TrichSKD4]